MLRYFDIEYVREHLDDLVEEAAAGNSFVITVKGWPKALVEPIDEGRVDRPVSKPKPVAPRRKAKAKS